MNHPSLPQSILIQYPHLSRSKDCKKSLCIEQQKISQSRLFNPSYLRQKDLNSQIIQGSQNMNTRKSLINSGGNRQKENQSKEITSPQVFLNRISNQQLGNFKSNLELLRLASNDEKKKSSMLFRNDQSVRTHQEQNRKVLTQREPVLISALNQQKYDQGFQTTHCSKVNLMIQDIDLQQLCRSNAEIGFHLIQDLQIAFINPSLQITRENTTDIQRQNISIDAEYGEQIDKYLRKLQLSYKRGQFLARHKITENLRARMVDWMVEVLINFKSNDQTFFLSVNLLDRYFQNVKKIQEIQDLHIIGVTSMFIASKFEDVRPLQMKMIYEKIGHKKLPVERIKYFELEILKAISYKIASPTILDFLKVYLMEVFNIDYTESANNKHILIYKMSIYLAKMTTHDYQISGKVPSLIAIGCLYIALKICEELTKNILITGAIVRKMAAVSQHDESDFIELSQKILYLAQNFEQEYQGLENLKKTHFSEISALVQV